MKTSTNRKQAKLRPGNFQPARGNDPGRISALKFKLESLRQRRLAAVRNGDYETKGWLETEVARLSATISRAETLVAPQMH